MSDLAWWQVIILVSFGWVLWGVIKAGVRELGRAWWSHRRARRNPAYQRQLAQLDAITAQVGRHVNVQLYGYSGQALRELRRTARSIEDLDWQIRIRRERTAAWAALDAMVDEAWARYGWERPA